MTAGFVFQEGLPNYRATFDAKGPQTWQGKLVKDDGFQISQAAAVLSYGQSILKEQGFFSAKMARSDFSGPKIMG